MENTVLLNFHRKQYHQPQILRKEHLTKLLTNDAHHQVHHAGIYHTFGKLRKKHRIPQRYVEVKGKIKNWLICMQYQEGPYKLKSMFLWPKSKVTASPDFKTLD